MTPYKTEYVRPETLLTYRGVTVYHVYKNDDINQGPRTFFFTLDEQGDEDDESTFDVRELRNWQAPERPPSMAGVQEDSPHYKQLKAAWNKYFRTETRTIRRAIREAIDKGLIAPTTWKRPLAEHEAEHDKKRIPAK